MVKWSRWESNPRPLECHAVLGVHAWHPTVTSVRNFTPSRNFNESRRDRCTPSFPHTTRTLARIGHRVRRDYSSHVVAHPGPQNRLLADPPRDHHRWDRRGQGQLWRCRHWYLRQQRRELRGGCPHRLRSQHWRQALKPLLMRPQEVRGPHPLFRRRPTPPRSYRTDRRRRALVLRHV